MKLKAVEQMLLERNNFELLQTPYLTEEEEQCYHLADINREQEMRLKKHMDIEEKMLKHRLLEDHLAHLNTTKAWE